MSGWWKGLVVPAALVIVAEGAMRIYGSTSMSLAAPSDVLAALVRALLDGSILVATLKISRRIKEVLHGDVDEFTTAPVLPHSVLRAAERQAPVRTYHRAAAREGQVYKTIRQGRSAGRGDGGDGHRPGAFQQLGLRLSLLPQDVKNSASIGRLFVA